MSGEIREAIAQSDSEEIEDVRDLLEQADTTEAVEAIRLAAPVEWLRAAFVKLGKSAKQRIRQLQERSEINELREMLEVADTTEAVEALRQIAPPKILRAAIAALDLVVQQRIEGFMAQLPPASPGETAIATSESPPAQSDEVEELREMLAIAASVEADDEGVETVEALRSIAPREILRAAFSCLGESAKCRIRQLRRLAIAAAEPAAMGCT